MVKLLRDHRDDWRALGSVEPFFGVLTADRFLRRNLDERTLAEFWASGELYVASVAALFEKHLGRELRPRRALDFGCGVGRVLLPLARRAGEVVGADVAAPMLAEARQAADAAGLGNVLLVELAGSAAGLPGPFDFVHTYNVLQHVPPALGLRLVRELLALLTPDGLALIHLTFARPGDGPLRRLARRLRGSLPLVHGFANLATGRPWSEPHMQMNVYDLNEVFAALAEAGCHSLYAASTDHGGMLGVALLVERRRPGLF